MTNESATDVWCKVVNADIRRQAHTVQTALNGKLRGFNQDTGTAYADTISHAINSDGSITYKLRVVDTLGAAAIKDVRRVKSLRSQLLKAAAAVQQIQLRNRYAYQLGASKVWDDVTATQRDCLARHVLRYLTLANMSVDWLIIPPPHRTTESLPPEAQLCREVIDAIPDINESLSDLVTTLKDELSPSFKGGIDGSFVEQILNTITGHLRHIHSREVMLSRMQAVGAGCYPDVSDAQLKHFNDARGLFLQAARRTVVRHANGALRTVVVQMIADEIRQRCVGAGSRADVAIEQLVNMADRKCEAAMFKLRALQGPILLQKGPSDKLLDLIQEIYDESFPALRRARIVEARKEESLDEEEA